MLRARKNAKGRRVTQSPPVSSAKFVKVSFRVRFILSTCPELWGLYSQCNFHFVPRAWASPCTTWLTEVGPLSEPMVTGSPCLGTSSSEIFLATTVAVSPLAGKASTALRRYLPEPTDTCLALPQGNLSPSVALALPLSTSFPCAAFSLSSSAGTLYKPGLSLIQLHFAEGTSGRPSGEVSRSFSLPGV